MTSLVLALAVMAATPPESADVDEVVLKNGSVVRGRLLEFNPASGGKIQTGEGSVVVFEAADVLKMRKVEPPAAPRAAPRGNPHVVIGAVGFGATWLLTVVVTAALRACCAIVAIPVVGPFLNIGVVADLGLQFYPGGEAMLIGSGLLQAGFATYLIVGAALGAPEPTVKLIPTSNGFALAGRF